MELSEQPVICVISICKIDKVSVNWCEASRQHCHILVAQTKACAHTLNVNIEHKRKHKHLSKIFRWREYLTNSFIFEHVTACIKHLYAVTNFEHNARQFRIIILCIVLRMNEAHFERDRVIYIYTCLCLCLENYSNRKFISMTGVIWL